MAETALTRVQWLFLSVLLIVAVLLRGWDFPPRYQQRDVDEAAYSQGALELLEGMTPAYKYSPAGPLTWLGWAYAGSHAVDYLVKPTPEERAVPLQVRPFVAVNHALFEQWHDLSGLRQCLVVFSDVVSIVAVAAAFAVGCRFAGSPGGVLLGGLFAAAPLMVRFAEQARPFSEGWSFTMIAMYFAVCRTGSLALWGSGIAAGLAVGSRIDMLPVLPILWAELWLRHPTQRGAWLAVLKQIGVSAATTLLVAPWLLTNLIGNLRTIFSVRFSTPPGGPIPMHTALLEFGWNEGLGLVALLLIAGVVVGLVRRRLAQPLVCLYALLLLSSVSKSTGHGIAHQGAAVVPLLMVVPLALAALTRSPRVAWGIVAVVLLLPLLVTLQVIVNDHRSWVPDDATHWVNTHVPAGTVLYLSPSFHDPLPTPAAADALWQEEMNVDAPMKKFRAGLARFHLQTAELPRALSEENMTDERVERRGWYLLGSRSFLPDPRYDLHLYGESMVFTPTDPLPLFHQTGGTLIYRGLAPLAGAGAPVAYWTNPSGAGTYIYCSNDIKSRLTP